MKHELTDMAVPHMTYDARQIANWFVARARRDNRALSIMSLLKLTYIAHGWHLEMTGKPLFGNEIKAWQYGPVVPEVYNDFRSQGVSVTEPVNSVPPTNLSVEDENLLEQVWTIYGSMSAFQLSDLTHVQGGPWHIATQTGGYYAHIPNDLIKQHYDLKRVEANQKVQNG